MSESIKLYGHAACTMVHPVRGLLKRTQVEFEYIDIYADSHARARVREINQGYESVPTLLFPDGTTLTEPSIGELKAKLETMGYHVPLRAQLIGMFPTLIFLAVIAIILLNLIGVI